MVRKRVWIIGVAVVVVSGSAVTAWALDKPPVRHISAPKSTVANSVSMASIVPGDELQLVGTNDPAEISHVSLDAVDRYLVVNKQTVDLEAPGKDPMTIIELRRGTTYYAFVESLRPHLNALIESLGADPVAVAPKLSSYTFGVVGRPGTVDATNMAQLATLCGYKMNPEKLSRWTPKGVVGG